MSNELVQRPTDYRAVIEQTLREYPLGLIHGFQKDAIQNASGARISPKGWEGWSCKIYLTEDSKFLCVEDFGTWGLTGPNLDNKEMERKIQEGFKFPEDYRLARLSCNRSSGGATTSAGLYGIGKTLYSAVSSEKTCTYYYESLTEHYGYRCNVNKINQSLVKTKEDEEGRQYIFEHTHLQPINHIGTRFIIEDPKPEVVNAIKNGQMYRYIQESWWRVLPYLKGESGIYLNGVKVIKPKEYGNEGEKEERKKDCYCTNFPINKVSSRKIKKFGFYIHKEEFTEESHLGGFYYYRRGMKIGQIKMADDFPEELKKRYYGFIEVDDTWENELAQIEDLSHYDTLRNKKGTSEYRELVNASQNIIHGLLNEWGYIKERENLSRKLHNEFEEMKNKVVDLFGRMEVEPIGHGDKKPTLSCRLFNVVLPEGRVAYDEDNISFSFLVTNNRRTTQEFIYEISIIKGMVNENRSVEQAMISDSIRIKPDDTYQSEVISFSVNTDRFAKFTQNSIQLAIKQNENVVAKKTLVFYYSTDPVKMPVVDFGLEFSDIQFPSALSKRVNTGESVKVSYSVINRTDSNVKAGLHVFIVDEEYQHGKIAEVGTVKFELKANEEIITDVFSVLFDEKITNCLAKGKLSIRAQLTCLEDSGLYSKAEILQKLKLYVFFNKNEKKGLEDSFVTRVIEKPDDKRMSWSEKENGIWSVYINISHPSFLAIDSSDEVSRDRYGVNQMIREFVKIYFSEGQQDKLDNTTTKEEFDKYSMIDKIRYYERIVSIFLWNEYGANK